MQVACIEELLCSVGRNHKKNKEITYNILSLHLLDHIQDMQTCEKAEHVYTTYFNTHTQLHIIEITR
jgi:hypothetical protein